MLKITIKINNTPTYYTFLETDSTIEGAALNRALNGDVESLIADVISGEVNLQFSNLYNEFNPRVETAPYKEIRNGQEVKVYSVANSIETTIFTGYIVDFKAPTSSETQSCTVRAVDRLHLLLNADIQSINLQVEKNITLAKYFSVLFAAYGLSEDDYQIDDDLLEISLNYSLLIGQKLSEQLAEICKATDSYIYCNRTGKIIVKATKITGIPVKTFTRQDHTNYLVNSEYGFSIFNSYNSLKIGYTAVQLSDVKQILNLENKDVPAGISEMNNIELGVSNLYELDTIKITSPSNIKAVSLSASASTISLTLNNPTNETEHANISVYGKTIDTTNSFITTPLNSELKQSLEISSLLLQDKDSAEALSERLYNRAIVEMPFIKAEVECVDFPIDLCYIVRVNDSDVGLDFTGYVHSIDLEYDGSGYCIVKLGIKALYEEVLADAKL